ncbi:hypothetical protein SCHIN_v1c06110 [Spiroplasma chinense]|uniref:Uncharacterized protein n=1 Tax=Spiroplasma chinense TaxID=216932 RepID=A0A5B9Y3S4_9MOLU|nr:hypothetical protein [Spiroplasma chinense]QEH61808.1 hypothetical protein SCHIN_v1c06110 [Spiroplasma chinense]
MEKCQLNNCGKDVNSLDPKRLYIYDELIEDEIPVIVCDSCYDAEKQADNDIDWSHSVDGDE